MRKLTVLAFVSFGVGCTGFLGLETVRFEGDGDAGADADAAVADEASVDASSETSIDGSSSGAPSSFLVWAGGGVPTEAGEDAPTAQVLIARVRDDGSLEPWKLGPDLPAARYRHSVVGVDGHVFVIGGGDSPATAPTGTAVFDIAIDADGNATVGVSDSPLPVAIADGCSSAANGKVYAKNYGGESVLTASVTSGKLGGWKETASLTTGEALSGSMVATSSALYAPASASGTKNVRSLALGGTFEPAAAAWMPVTPAPRAVANGGVAFSPLATDGTHLYVVGSFSDTDQLEPKAFGASLANGSLAWEELEPFALPRKGHGAVATRGHLYVAGGRNEGGGDVIDVSYAPILSDGKLGNWTKTASLLSARYGRCSLAAVTVARK